MRPDGRAPNQLRSFEIIPHWLKDPEGSALVRAGQTWVLCTASVEEKVPPFLRDSGSGWVTAEYSMLPRATTTRSGRGPNGRAKEIERLIGRSLRAAIDLKRLGARTITIDCDVLQADGGTRTAAISGGWVALELAVQTLVKNKRLTVNPIKLPMAAVSVGVIDGEARLDLAYEEDARAEVDMNVVMMATNQLVEIQGTAEQGTFDRAQLNALLDLAEVGIGQIYDAQARAVATVR